MSRRVFERDVQPFSQFQKRLFELIEAGSVAQVEQAVDLGQVAIETACQFRLPDAQCAHFPVQRDLRLAECREKDGLAPALNGTRARNLIPILPRVTRLAPAITTDYN